jgi:hypothetical protein
MTEGGQPLACRLHLGLVMKNTIRTLAVLALLLAPAATVHAQISFGIRIGEPPPPHAYRVPPRPGPDYVWVEGYQYPEGGHYKWHDGYWTRPPYEGAYWVEPYHTGGQYFAGHWEGPRGNVAHDHRWDKSPQHDAGHNPQNDHR